MKLIIINYGFKFMVEDIIPKDHFREKIAHIFQKNKLDFPQYFLLLIYSLTISIIISALVSYFSYQNNILSQKKTYDYFAENIEESLDSIFDNTFLYLKYIAKSILKNQDFSSKDIETILKNEKNNDFIDKSFYSWTFLDWIDNKHMLVINSGIGRYDNPINLSHRKDLNHGKENPWQLFFSGHMFGRASGDHVITLSMAVSNGYGFSGTLALSILVQSLKDKINRYFLGADFNYLVLNQFGEIMIDSQKQLDFDYNKTHIKNIELINVKNKNIKTGLFNIFNTKIKFLYKSKKYPYFIEIQVDNSLKKFMSLFLPNLYTALTINIFFILFFIYCRIYLNRFLNSLHNYAIDRYTGIIKDPNFSNNKLHELSGLQTFFNNVIEENYFLQQENLNIALKLEQITTEKNYIFSTIFAQIKANLSISNQNLQELLSTWKSAADHKKIRFLDISNCCESNAINILDSYIELFDEKLLEFNIDKQVNLAALLQKSINYTSESLEFFESKKNININIDNESKLYITADQKKLLIAFEKIFEFCVDNKTKESKIDIFIKNNSNMEDFILISIFYTRDSLSFNEIKLFFSPFCKAYSNKLNFLNLAMSKKIIELHNGKIWVENNTGKEGVNIYIALPLEIDTMDSIKLKEKFSIITKNGTINLSKRELECAKLLIEGETAKGMARILNINTRTVEAHIKNIKLKTGLSYRSDLLKFLKVNVK